MHLDFHGLDCGGGSGLVSKSCLTLCDPRTVHYQAPPSMGFSRQECWSGLPFPSLGDLPDPGIEPGFPALQTDALLSEPPGKLLCTMSAMVLSYMAFIMLRYISSVPSLSFILLSLT